MTHPLDRSNLREMILGAPDQLAVGFRLAKGIHVPGTFENIMISGMGGSALPGNLFRVFLGELARRGEMSRQRIGIFQNRFYSLPHEAYDNCLNLFCSYSGNTEETLASFEEAVSNSLPVIGISAGGKLETLCQERGIPHVKLPLPSPDFQPRMGTGYFLGAMYQLLVNHGLAPDITRELEAISLSLKQDLPKIEEEGKALALTLKGKTPVVYASPCYKSVAMIWKIKINENAKTPAFWNFFPELNHNEMVGWTLPQGQFIVLMLRDLDDHPRNLKRYDITAELLREKGVEVVTLDMEGESVYTKVFKTLALGDFASYYLALEYGQDPTPVDMVEDLKKRLVA